MLQNENIDKQSGHYSGFIDIGRQLAILHSLLDESFSSINEVCICNCHIVLSIEILYGTPDCHKGVSIKDLYGTLDCQMGVSIEDVYAMPS